ncbi:DUF2809 domain-containing protein, partial [Chitinophaga sp.]|uniref:ribosomal maturation YjgA family protein n=1 Tax=Chitinophaga sp. TaxID=1869181 RepID=UPI002C854577
MAAKRRWIYFFLILLNIPLGLATRWAPQYFPGIVRIYGGDVLSATCIFFGIRFLFPVTPLWKIGISNYAVCLLIEIQQLYQAEWAVRIRNTPAGILLGHGFLW